MRPPIVVLLTLALALELAATGGPARASRSTSVAAFYYVWYGTPGRDGAWRHWDQGGNEPPSELATSYAPVRGAYSSADVAVVRGQMGEMARAGIDTVVVSWWGTGSHEDDLLPLVRRQARVAGLSLAVHIEPYLGRTPATVVADIDRLRSLGIGDFYVYDSTLTPDAEWAGALAGIEGVRVFANTGLVGRALAGGFQGIYTYDVLVNNGSSFRRICHEAHAVGLVCAPSVGPGFDATHATSIAAVRPRNAGRTYDTFWRDAIRSSPDLVTLTSYNEWHEGTQIEPARSAPGHASYDGDYGLHGASAETAYLDRTRYWVDRLHAS